MPHHVMSATAVGSAGDLGRITEALHAIGVNIVAVGGGEGVVDDQEIGVVAMLLDPDDDTDAIAKALEKVNLKHVAFYPDHHVELPDQVGALEKAAKAVHGINIRSVVSIDKHDGVAHVSLGFSEADHGRAKDALDRAGIKITHDHDHGPSSPPAS